MKTEQSDTARNVLRIRGRWQPLLRFGFAAALGVVFLYFVSRGRDWGQAFGSLFSIPPGALAAAVALFLLGSYLSAVRWRLLLAGQTISPRRLFLVQNTGLGADAVSPVKALSIPVQFMLLTSGSGLRPAPVLSSIAVKRVMDLAVNVALILAGFLLIEGARSAWPLLLPAVGWSVLAWFGIVGAGALAGSGVFGKLAEGGSLRQATKEILGSRRRLLLAVAICTANWSCFGLAAWVLLTGYGLDLAPHAAVFVGISTMLFSGSIPALPAGIGSFEFAFVHLLGSLGPAHTTALTAAIAFHGVILIPAVIIAGATLAAFFWRKLPSRASVS